MLLKIQSLTIWHIHIQFYFLSLTNTNKRKFSSSLLCILLPLAYKKSRQEEIKKLFSFLADFRRRNNFESHVRVISMLCLCKFHNIFFCLTLELIKLHKMFIKSNSRKKLPFSVNDSTIWSCFYCHGLLTRINARM
jgi:hypothetical protein